jgi:hypothetical protein
MFLGELPRVVALLQPWANFRSAFSAEKAAFASEGRLHWLSLIYLPGGVVGAGGFAGDSICA